jgi:hypothetical protein
MVENINKRDIRKIINTQDIKKIFYVWNMISFFFNKMLLYFLLRQTIWDMGERKRNNLYFA